MSRKKPEILYAFHRFLEGIFSYYFDKGMPKERAKIRMYKESYDTMFDLIKEEKDVPDHILVTTMQHASRHLNRRGFELSKKIRENPENTEEIRKALHEIKKLKDHIDSFITTYKGDADE